ncbi:MAG: fibronectin type III domain-containing protein, partial [Bacteroidales bacterium]|nr:fibronectin type III domain-containing protein [Bacteroidales bacterium]
MPTDENILELPYEQNFDDLEDLASWDMWTVTQNGVNKWYLGSIGARLSEDSEEGQGLYISNNNGVTNTYDPQGDNSVAHLSTLINIEEGNYYAVEFDYKAVGEISWDDVAVSLFPVGESLPETNTIPSARIIGTSNSNTNQWTRVSVLVPQNIQPNVYQLVLSWRNDGGGGNTPPASIDNLHIFYTSCARVNEFTATMEDADGSVTMNIEVTDSLNSDAEYILNYRYGSDTTWYTMEGESPFIITDLPYSTNVYYTVTARCAEDELAAVSNVHTKRTLCGPISEFPYVENFEENTNVSADNELLGNRSALPCWYIIDGGSDSYNWMSVYTGEGINDSKAYRFYGTYSTYTTYEFSDWMITPVFALTGNERLNFQYKLIETTNYPVIDVYAFDVSENAYSSMADTANFTLITTINTAGLALEEWNMAEILLSEYSGNTRLALAVRQQAASFYIDDFTISAIPDCPDLYGFNAVAGELSASVSYNTSNVGEAGVTVAYAEVEEGVEFDLESASTVTIPADAELPYQITDLTEGTTYILAAQQACDGAWSEPVTITVPIVYTLPQSFDFDTEETTPVMQFASNSANTWFIGAAQNNTMDESGALTEGRALYISTDGGVTAGYNSSSYTDADAILPLSIEPTGEIHVSFDWKSVGEYNDYTSWDYLTVALVSGGADFNTGIVLAEQLYAHSDWQSFSGVISADTLNGVYNLVFRWHNDYGSTTGNPAGVVDNLELTTVACSHSALHTNLVFTETEESETGAVLVVELTDIINTDVPHILRYKESTSSTWTEVPDLTLEDFPYTIPNAAFQTIYNVQVGVTCPDAEEPAFAEQVDITTPCQSLSAPWFENFENSDMFATPSCWSKYRGIIPASGQINTSALTNMGQYGGWDVYTSNTIGTNSTKKLRANIYSSNRYWAVTPTIDLGDGSTIYQVAFDLAVCDYGNTNPPEGPSPDDKFMLLVSLDNGASWNTANALVFADNDEDVTHNYSDLTNVLTRYAYKLVDENDEPLTGLVRFAIYGESTEYAQDNDVFVDNLSVEPWSECPTPYGIVVSDIQSTTAEASFQVWPSTTTWEYVIVEASNAAEADFDGATPIQIITTDIIELTELTPNTDYVFAMRSICDGDVVSSWVAATPFRTLPALEPIPYFTSFENEEDAATWTSINNTTPNVWVVGDAAGNEAPAAYISNDQGETHAATLGTSTSRAFFYKDFSFGTEPQDYELSFDWKMKGRHNEDNGVYCAMYVYLQDITPISTSSTPSSSNRVASVYGSEDWTNEKVILSQVSGDKRLIFYTWGYTDENEITTPAAIDNISIDVPSCMPPVLESVTATDLTATSATINWTDNDESHSSWNLYYRAVMDTVYEEVAATTPSVELSELIPNTLYYVYVTTDCGGEESAHTTTMTFRTECAPELAPWFEDFETNVAGSQCWSNEVGALSENVILGGSADWYSTQDAIGGNTTGKAYNNIYMGAEADWLITPQIDLGESGDLYEVSFEVAVSAWGSSGGAPDVDTDATFAVVVSNDGGSTWSNANALIYKDGDADTEHNFTDLTNTFQTVTYLLQDAEGNPLTGIIRVGLYVGKTLDNNSDNNVYIDNLSIHISGQEPGEDPEPQPCDAPTALAASNITQTTADITWNGTATSYEFKLNGGTAEALTATTKSLTGLTANTQYTVEVRAVCEDQTSDWVTTTFTTLVEQGEEVVAPTVTTLAATAITHESAVLNGTITAGSETISAQGFMYKATAAADWTTVNATGTTISATLTALTAETEYTFKAFATTASGTVEGEAMSFTTTAAPVVIVAPEVVTLAASEITHESATLNGTITAGSEEITAQGFMYKATADADWTTVNATGETISATLTALTAETEYTFKAFATTASGTVEGTAMTFTTTAAPIVAPTVVTLAATEITNATAKLNGTVTAGSEEIVAQGFMYKASNAADWTTVAAVGETMSLTVEG